MNELFRLFGTIAINNQSANDAIEETTETAEKSHGKIKGAFEKIGKAAVEVGKAIGAGLLAGGAAISKLGKSAIEAYGDYEQLVGGVETLFDGAGKSYADFYKELSAEGKTLDEINAKWFELQKGQTTVLENAANAYKTAGMSANEYMETVTSFSASLIQSLEGDTTRAAEVAHTAILDMSDNANKMGSDMESIQNAYNGFAKQNFTMLDNLKLGYGGTKEEMQRLLEDAEKISGIKYDISSFADITEAIHVMQEEMGIAGTTAKEASTTIQGSISSMKASWQNVLVGLADEESDLDALLNNFVESTITVVENILPRITIIASNVPKLVTSIVSQVPGIIQDILPSVIEAAVSLVSGLVSALPQIVSALVAVLPLLLDGLKEITQALVAAIPDVVDALVGILTDATTMQALFEAAIVLFTAIVTAIPDIIPQLIDAAPDIIMGIVTGLMNALPTLLSSLGRILKSFLNAFLAFFGIHSPSSVMQEKAKFIVDGVINGLKALPEKASEIFQNMKNKISEKINSARDTVKGAIDKIKSFFKFTWSLPKLKMPHFKISGKFNLNPPSAPKFGIEWYKTGGILTDPTAFGINPKSGKLMVGGEAGAEAIAPIDTLLGYIRTAVQEQNSGIAYLLERLISMLAEYFPEILNGMDRQVVLSTGEIVGALTPHIDGELGNINRKRERGG